MNNSTAVSYTHLDVYKRQEQVEKLALQHGNDEIEGGIGIAHNEEQRCFPVAHCVQL